MSYLILYSLFIFTTLTIALSRATKKADAMLWRVGLKNFSYY
jgi:hypothetical protein